MSELSEGMKIANETVAGLALKLSDARAEITTLRAQLEEARAKAIEECAQVATNFAEVTARLDGGIKSTAAAGMFKLAASIRALLHGSTK